MKIRPVVSGIRSITYLLVRNLVDLLKPLVGKAKRHIQNSNDLVDKLQETVIKEGEVSTSFDITALFSSVLGNEVVQIVIRRASSDPTCNERTLLIPDKFGDLLKMVVETTYFRFQVRFMNRLLACPWVHHSHLLVKPVY